MDPRGRSAPVWALLLAGLPNAYQMGIIYFATRSFAVEGRVPLPLDLETIAPGVAVGYLAAILLCLLWPRREVLFCRVCYFVALACHLAFFLPLPAPALAVLVKFGLPFGFAGVLLGTVAIFVNVLDVESATWGTLGAMLVYCPVAALMQNEWAVPSFFIFNALSVLCLAAALPLCFLLPAAVELPRAGGRPPAGLTWGAVLLATAACCTLLFATSVAESAPHGVFLFNLAGGGVSALLLWRWRKGARSPFKLCAVVFQFVALGFALAMLPFPAGRLLAGVFNAGTISVTIFIPVFFNVLYRQWPARWLPAAGVLIGMVTALGHSALLEALRDRQTLLHAIYLVAAILTIGGVALAEPYLSRAWVQLTRPPAEPPPAAPAGALAGLSEQERNLAELILQGYSESEIAARMNISLNTQKSYRRNLYSKLGIHSKRELFAAAQ